jgi:hypothetical protein
MPIGNVLLRKAEQVKKIMVRHLLILDEVTQYEKKIQPMGVSSKLWKHFLRMLLNTYKQPTQFYQPFQAVSTTLGPHQPARSPRRGRTQRSC